MWPNYIQACIVSIWTTFCLLRDGGGGGVIPPQKKERSKRPLCLTVILRPIWALSFLDVSIQIWISWEDCLYMLLGCHTSNMYRNLDRSKYTTIVYFDQSKSAKKFQNWGGVCSVSFQSLNKVPPPPGNVYLSHTHNFLTPEVLRCHPHRPFDNKLSAN